MGVVKFLFFVFFLVQPIVAQEIILESNYINDGKINNVDGDIVGYFNQYSVERMSDSTVKYIIKIFDNTLNYGTTFMYIWRGGHVESGLLFEDKFIFNVVSYDGEKTYLLFDRNGELLRLKEIKNPLDSLAEFESKGGDDFVDNIDSKFEFVQNKIITLEGYYGKYKRKSATARTKVMEVMVRAQSEDLDDLWEISLKRLDDQWKYAYPKVLSYNDSVLFLASYQYIESEGGIYVKPKLDHVILYTININNGGIINSTEYKSWDEFILIPFQVKEENNLVKVYGSFINMEGKRDGLKGIFTAEAKVDNLVPENIKLYSWDTLQIIGALDRDNPNYNKKLQGSFDDENAQIAYFYSNDKNDYIMVQTGSDGPSQFINSRIMVIQFDKSSVIERIEYYQNFGNYVDPDFLFEISNLFDSEINSNLPLTNNIFFDQSGILFLIANNRYGVKYGEGIGAYILDLNDPDHSLKETKINRINKQIGRTTAVQKWNDMELLIMSLKIIASGNSLIYKPASVVIEKINYQN